MKLMIVIIIHILLCYAFVTTLYILYTFITIKFKKMTYHKISHF